MPNLAEPTPPSDANAHRGFVVRAPAELGDPFTVRVPDFDDQHVFEIRRWEYRGSTLPQVDDEVLVVIDDEAEPWVAAWWPAAGDDPGGGGAVDSVFGRTGVVISEPGDYDVSEVTNAASKAELGAKQDAATAATDAELTAHAEDTTAIHGIADTSALATKSFVETADGLLIPKSLLDAKGDLIAASANDTPARVAVGENGQVLTADSTQTAGVKWATPEAGSPDYKTSVRVATTANITVSTALNNGDSLDGVTLATGDRVLVKDQSTKAENGIWIVGVTPTRATDADAAGELSGGTQVYVEEGTRNKRRTFRILTAGSITPGTTAHEWGQLYPRDFGLVEALPTSEAVKGDRCSYYADKANGVVWDLIYDGAGEYPWKKVGGPPLNARSDPARGTTSTAYATPATDPMAITIPLKGDYDIEIEGSGFPAAGAERFGYISYAVGATAASDAWAAVRQVSGASFGNTAASKKTRHTAVAAAASIAEKIRTGNAAYSMSWEVRRLWVDPVRVG